jgi:hypothetical protein
MPRFTLRDLADRQHGKSKAMRDLTPTFGGWLRPTWCAGCQVPLTTTDTECGRCTSCGTKIPRRRTR